ncbi:14249_t:CDS:2, partial [Cetraspora pellucida]
ATLGVTPESRGHFTSVLGESTKGYNHAATPTLVVLDLSAEPFTWISQNVSGDFIPPSLLLHTANVVNNYMIIAYGFNYQTNLLSSDIYILDISNDSEYKWVNEFNLNQKNPSLVSFPTYKSTCTDNK